jgi:Bacterial SH3 domain
MGQSALSSSDTVIRPISLSERLAAETAAEPPAPPEAMAERFAPDAPKGITAAGGPTIIEPPRIQGFGPEPGRSPSGNRALLAASMIISLVPTAIILGLLWQGAIRLPSSDRMTLGEDDSQAPSSQQSHPNQQSLPSQQASVVSMAPLEAEAKPDIALTTEAKIEAKAGEEVPFSIAIDSADTLPPRSVIAIRAMPQGAAFSQGRPYGESEWNLTPDEVGDLRLRLPKGLTGGADLRVELMAADGTVLATAATRLDIAQDPRSALILRSDESDRIEDLIKHGQKMVEVGYLAGARAYFKRAVEAGSGQAALLLGATYDPAFIEKIGAQGIKPDLGEARAWYERAKQLGIEDADAKLDELANEWPDNRDPVQAAQEGAAPPAVAEAGTTGGADASADSAPASSAVTAAVAPAPAVPATASPDAAPVPGKEEWVALSGYANVRAAPSSTAETLRIAEKGAKLRVTGRKGNWVQVTDPATSETGWVYSRFIETAQSPAR